MITVAGIYSSAETKRSSAARPGTWVDCPSVGAAAIAPEVAKVVVRLTGRTARLPGATCTPWRSAGILVAGGPTPGSRKYSRQRIPTGGVRAWPGLGLDFGRGEHLERLGAASAPLRPDGRRCGGSHATGARGQHRQHAIESPNAAGRLDPDGVPHHSPHQRDLFGLGPAWREAGPVLDERGSGLEGNPAARLNLFRRQISGFEDHLHRHGRHRID